MDLFEKLERLPEPVQVTHKFIGGPLDGQTKTGKTNYVLTDKVIVTINGASYRYAGNDTFQFIGIQQSAPEPKLNILQRAKLALLKWLLT